MFNSIPFLSTILITILLTTLFSGCSKKNNTPSYYGYKKSLFNEVKSTNNKKDCKDCFAVILTKEQTQDKRDNCKDCFATPFTGELRSEKFISTENYYHNFL